LSLLTLYLAVTARSAPPGLTPDALVRCYLYSTTMYYWDALTQITLVPDVYELRNAPKARRFDSSEILNRTELALLFILQQETFKLQFIDRDSTVEI
jgi:hypothetical protein